MMPRNLDARVELLVRLKSDDQRADLQDTLDRCFADDSGSWTLGADGRWWRRSGSTRSVQSELMARTLAASAPATLG